MQDERSLPEVFYDEEAASRSISRRINAAARRPASALGKLVKPPVMAVTT
jgi:hypothetical protein